MPYRIRARKNQGYEVRVIVPKHLREYVGKTRDRRIAKCKTIKVACALLEHWEQVKLDEENGIQVSGPSFNGMVLTERLRTVDSWVGRHAPTAENHLNVLRGALRGVEDEELRD